MLRSAVWLASLTPNTLYTKPFVFKYLSLENLGGAWCSMRQKILIEAGKFAFEAELNDKMSKETCKKVVEALPVESKAQVWGEEVYFSVGFGHQPENATTDVRVGDIAFWPDGPAIAIFFGKTPMSKGEKPVPYSECNVVGRLLDVAGDREKLLQVKQGERVVVRKL